MHKAYYTLDLAEGVLLKDHLVRNGIGASVENRGPVRRPYEGIATEVWVPDDADDVEVMALIQSFLIARQGRPGPASSAWRCRDCREENPGEFELCWSCGQARGGSYDPGNAKHT